MLHLHHPTQPAERVVVVVVVSERVAGCQDGDAGWPFMNKYARNGKHHSSLVLKPCATHGVSFNE